MVFKFDLVNEELNKEYGLEINRFFKNVDKLKLWVNDVRFKLYRKMINDILDLFNYKLLNDVEEYLNEVVFGEFNLEDVFNILIDVELRYDDVFDLKNKKYKFDLILYLKMFKFDDVFLCKNVVL